MRRTLQAIDSKYLPVILIFITFAVSRILLLSHGLAFQSSTIGAKWQFLDPEWLREDLFSSLFYLHSQPPLFNLYIGLVYKFFPEHSLYIFQSTFLCLGLTIYLSIYGTLRTLGFRWITAYLAATLYIIGPEAILYENSFFYTWPVICLLMIAIYAFVKYESSGSMKFAVYCLFAIASLCLIRSVFHLLYLILALGLLACIHSRNSKKLLLAGSLAITLVSAVYVKNLLLFDYFGTSSWLGMNMWRIAAMNVDQADEARKKYDLPTGYSFQAIPNFSDALTKVPERHHDIPVLASPTKTNGEINFNHYGYLNISKVYKQAAFEVIRQDIPAYLSSVKLAWFYYSFPVWPAAVKLQPQAIQTYVDRFTLTGVRLDLEEKLSGERPPFPVSSIILAPTLLLFAIIYVFTRLVFTRQFPTISTVFILLTVYYIAFLGNAIELYENNRFRSLTSAPLLILLFLSFKDIFQLARSKSGRQSSPEQSNARREHHAQP